MIHSQYFLYFVVYVRQYIKLMDNVFYTGITKPVITNTVQSPLDFITVRTDCISIKCTENMSNNFLIVQCYTLHALVMRSAMCSYKCRCSSRYEMPCHWFWNQMSNMINWSHWVIGFQKFLGTPKLTHHPISPFLWSVEWLEASLLSDDDPLPWV